VTFSSGDKPTEWSSDAASEAIHIYIDACALAHFAKQHFEAPVPIRDFFGANDPWLAAYFRLLALECALCSEVKGPPASFFLDVTEELLLRHLVRSYSDAARGGARLVSERGRVSPLRHGLVRRVESYIEANLERRISLLMLAQVAHMSIDHFVRAFRAATGETPHRFVIGQRLAHATALLKAGQVSVAQVARACGFRSAAHFSVKFRARFGATPVGYRRGFGASQAGSGAAASRTTPRSSKAGSDTSGSPPAS
jgi:AraC family transcriptional regulator